MRRPNVLWILTDEQRADSLHLGGAPWAVSPHLDQLAASGTRYASAYTPSPVCVAARVAMLTGRAPSATGVLNNHHQLDPARARFLTDGFRDAGYQTASFGKLHLNCRGARPFETLGGRTLDEAVHYYHYADPDRPSARESLNYPNQERPWILAGRFPGELAETAEAQNVGEALAWLDRRDPDRPYLLRVSLNAPHTPVVAPAPYDTRIDPAEITLPSDDPFDPAWPGVVREYFGPVAGTHRLTPEELARARQGYYGRCAFVDEVVGQLLTGARGRGALDGTIIAFCSDHGTHLGDHGFLQKQSWFEESARVPFLLSGEGIEAGRVVDHPVNLASLLPTLLELAGLDIPEPCEYASLADGPLDEPVIGEIDYGIWGYRDGERYAMVREGEWKLALYAGHDVAHPMLSNLAEDPLERRSFVDDPRAAAVTQRLLGYLADWDARVAAGGAGSVG